MSTMLSRSSRRAFVVGFDAVLPLWLVALPFALAFAAAAREAGWSLRDTQLMSLTVFSAALQLTAIGLIGAGASSVTVLGTTALLNLYLLLLGGSLGRLVPLTRAQRWIAAYFLTDGAYGVTVSGQRSFGFLLGAELSMFLAWNVCTLLGALGGRLLPDPARLDLDFVVPLTFLALLIGQLRTRADLVTALGAMLVMRVVGPRLAPGIGLLIAVVCGAAIATLLESLGVLRQSIAAGERRA